MAKEKIERFKCKECNGEGWTDEFGKNPNDLDMEAFVITDCEICKGLGFIELLIIDKRERSKDKTLNYLKEY